MQKNEILNLGSVFFLIRGLDCCGFIEFYGLVRENLTILTILLVLLDLKQLSSNF